MEMLKEHKQLEFSHTLLTKSFFLYQWKLDKWELVTLSKINELPWSQGFITGRY